MRIQYLVPLVILLAGLCLPAAAQDPLVYRECMALCKEFKDRGCCNEVCSYNACIADKTRASIGHGTRKDGVRLDQTDPGAWSAAMAACYPWISILKECHAGTPGTAASGGTAGGSSSGGGAMPPTAPVGRIVLRRVGAPKAEATDANWTTVKSGNIVNQGYGYKGTYTWDEPPAEIGENGFSTKLTAVAECENGQRMAGGLTIAGEFDMTGPNDSKPVNRVDFPANCDSKPDMKVAGGGGGTVKVVPKKYAAGSKVKLRVGVFWGRGVDYEYEAVAP